MCRGRVGGYRGGAIVSGYLEGDVGIIREGGGGESNVQVVSDRFRRCEGLLPWVGGDEDTDHHVFDLGGLHGVGGGMCKEGFPSIPDHVCLGPGKGLGEQEDDGCRQRAVN